MVVPAFNEADNLRELLPRLAAVLQALAPVCEVIVVDDGSTDGTAQLLAQWAQMPGCLGLRLSRNFGKEAALTAGLDAAKGEVVVLMDADLQHPPEMIPQLLQAWRAGADMVCTAKASRAAEGWRKRVATRLFYRIVNADNRAPIPVDAGDFRLLDRKVVRALQALPERNRFMKGLYAWVGFRTEVIPYEPAERMSGHSSFSSRRLRALAFTGITAFTNAPLRLWSVIGATAAFVGLGFGVYIILEYLILGQDVPGWATLVVGLAFSGGLQLLSVGILGEYVGRIFDEVKQRPVYILGEALGAGLQGHEGPERHGRHERHERHEPHGQRERHEANDGLSGPEGAGGAAPPAPASPGTQARPGPATPPAPPARSLPHG
ncbi:MAG: glycosyltransferase family 2 protein [Rubrivivax sp.]